MSNAQLGYGKRRLVAEIIKKTWDVEDPYQIKLGLNDIYYIVQEMNAEEGKAYLENRPLSARGFNVFRYFAQHLLYRNLANYDSMVLLTSDKGCLTDDAKIMLPRDLLKYPDGVPIKDLIDKGEIYVYSFNINTKKLELKKSDGVEFVKNDDVYEVELTTGQKINATSEHPFLLMDGSYKQLKDLVWLGGRKDTDRLRMIFPKVSKYGGIIKNIKHLGKKNVYDIVNVRDNHNFIANGFVVSNSGKSSAAILLARAWCNIIGIKFNPSRHIAYSNRDVMNKIEILNKWEPLIADESVRFCCVEGNTLIQTKEGEFRIKDLVDKTNFEVLSYDEKTKQFEYKKAEKCIKTKTDYVYELETFCGKKIRCTKEHKFLTNDGWKKLKELIDNDILINDLKIKSITKLTKTQTYDIINVKDNNNYIANGFIVHNSTMDWAKKESKELRKKLAEVRTKHLLFILCFPLKVTKVEKTYLDSFVNYWIALFGRGVGSIFVKDQNPANDPWRIKEFKDIGSYTEFTSITDIEKKLKKHPNFWQIIKFPKPPDWLYQKYLEIREKNVYNEDSVRESVTVEDVHRALMVLALQDIMMNDVTFSMNRIALHIKNTYDIPITKKHIQAILYDSKQLITKIREEEIDAK